MMTFVDFKNYIAKEINKYTEENYEVELKEVPKNNTTFTGLTLKGSSNICPTIYLDDYYHKYTKGKSIEDILEEIAEIRAEHDVATDFDVSMVTDFEKVKSRIKPRIYGIANNIVVKNRPYIEFADDLAITFCIDLGDLNGAAASIPITHDLIKNWNVNVNDLYEVAIQNIDDYVFKSMNELMAETMIPQMMDDMGVDREAAQEMVESMMPPEDKMFVLSNKQKLNGAVEIINDKAIAAIIDKVSESFYILPSSIHEVLIIKDDGTVTPDDLREMVKEVNDTQVRPEERLSYSVYKYEDGKVVKA